MLEKKEEIKRIILEGTKKISTISFRFLCCSGNQFVVNEAHNQRLVKDKSNVFDSRHSCSFGTASVPPYNPYY